MLCVRWGCSRRRIAESQKASMVERHDELWRHIFHRIASQCQDEGLDIPFNGREAETTIAKNAILVAHGVSLYQAVTGRIPNLLREFESPGQIALADERGASGTRHTVRLREIAISATIEGTAQDRFKRTAKSNTRPAIERLELKPGELVDLYRSPANKDVVGCRGPASVLGVTARPPIRMLGRRGPASVVDVNAEAGYVTARWQGKSLVYEATGIIHHLFLAFMAMTIGARDSLAVAMVREAIHKVAGTKTRSWVRAPKGWTLSRAALDTPRLFTAILSASAHDIRLVGCVGGRIGQRARRVKALSRFHKQRPHLLEPKADPEQD